MQRVNMSINVLLQIQGHIPGNPRQMRLRKMAKCTP